MSKAEEIAEELITQYVLDEDFVVIDDYRYLFKKAMRAHTSQILQELKERVEGLEINNKLFEKNFEMSDETKEYKEMVLQLIEVY